MRGFENIIGHEKIESYLDKVLETNKISHSYIFSGNKGLGKTNVAKVFAQNLQEDFSENIPDCKVIGEDGSSIGIDIVRRELVDDVYIEPFSKRWKIYIIKNATKMTIQAQNTLLKTLEEPPKYAIIILIVNDDSKILDTVKSRCIKLAFTPPDRKIAIEHIVRATNVSKEDAGMFADIAECNIGKAITYANIYMETKFWKRAIDVIKRMDDMNTYEIMSFIDLLDDETQRVFLDMINMYFRDLLTYKATNDINDIVMKELRTEIIKKVRIMSYSSIYRCIDSLTEALSRIEANAGRHSVLEILLFKLKENCNGTSDRS